jgi:GNAT superfamily N-acetyltransferase
VFDPALLSRIEDAGLNASAPPQQRLLDGWLLRLSPGKAKRARCVNALYEGRLPLAERIAQSQAVFADAGLPFIVRITPFSAPAHLDAHLADLGLRRFDDTRVMVCPSIPADTPPALDLQPVNATTYAEAVGSLRGSPPAQRVAQAERLATSPVPYRGFVLHEGKAMIACGQYAREGSLVGLYDVYTAPSHRGRGLARSLCRHLLQRARAEGACTAYLQVEADNAPARAVYHGLGFADGYAYHYRTPDPTAA